MLSIAISFYIDMLPFKNMKVHSGNDYTYSYYNIKSDCWFIPAIKGTGDSINSKYVEGSE